ncbi:MAG: FKBP-type peptidyl-prolyl cis-trans isomerase [Rhizobacter sp.]|nr:FKBP-type peptidyl-prolyl cis-trans isomerase [Ferruginibacter sp.]
MRKISFVAALAILALSACKESFKKGEKGSEYKIITSGSGEKIKVGDFIYVEIGQFYNNGKIDSLLSDSRTSAQGPMIQPFDTTSIPPEFSVVLKQLRKGDSAVVRILVDSVFKEMAQAKPPAFKNGHYLLTTIKIVDILKTPAAADSARTKAMEITQQRMKAQADELIKKDDKTIADFLAKNKITAVKGALGTYVQILQPGSGPNVDTSSVVSINYTGKTMEGKTFDSNTDPAFNHVKPLLANLTSDPSLGMRVVPGWNDGLKLLNKGAKAKFYIPSSLGYGPQGNGGDIAPNAILVFEIEVLDILDRTAAAAAAAVEQKEMQEMQKRYMDSIQKAQPQTAPQPR